MSMGIIISVITLVSPATWMRSDVYESIYFRQCQILVTVKLTVLVPGNCKSNKFDDFSCLSLQEENRQQN